MEKTFVLNLDNPFMANAIEFNRTIGLSHDEMCDIIYSKADKSLYSVVHTAQSDLLKSPTHTDDVAYSNMLEYDKQIKNAFVNTSTLSALGASPNAHAIVYFDNYQFDDEELDPEDRYVPPFLHCFPSISVELPTYVMTVVFFDRTAIRLFAQHMYTEVMRALTDSYQYHKAIKFNNEFIDILDYEHHTMITGDCTNVTYKVQYNFMKNLSEFFSIDRDDVNAILRKMNPLFKPGKKDVSLCTVKSAMNMAKCNLVLTKLLAFAEKLNNMCEDDRSCSEHFQEYGQVLYGDARMSFVDFLANIRDVIPQHDIDDINDDLCDSLYNAYYRIASRNSKMFTAYEAHEENYMFYTFDKLFTITARDIVQMADMIFEYYALDVSSVNLMPVMTHLNDTVKSYETTYKEFR